MKKILLIFSLFAITVQSSKSVVEAKPWNNIRVAEKFMTENLQQFIKEKGKEIIVCPKSLTIHDLLLEYGISEDEFCEFLLQKENFVNKGEVVKIIHAISLPLLAILTYHYNESSRTSSLIMGSVTNNSIFCQICRNVCMTVGMMNNSGLNLYSTEEEFNDFRQKFFLNLLKVNVRLAPCSFKEFKKEFKGNLYEYALDFCFWGIKKDNLIAGKEKQFWDIVMNMLRDNITESEFLSMLNTFYLEKLFKEYVKEELDKEKRVYDDNDSSTELFLQLCSHKHKKPPPYVLFSYFERMNKLINFYYSKVDEYNENVDKESEIEREFRELIRESIDPKFATRLEEYFTLFENF